jgi:hypothetical protein
MDKLRERIKSWQNLAEIFLKEDIAVYIKDYSDNFYFGNLLYVGESTVTVECFAPEQKKGQKHTLYWYSIDKFEGYKNEVVK